MYNRERINKNRQRTRVDPKVELINELEISEAKVLLQKIHQPLWREKLNLS